MTRSSSSTLLALTMALLLMSRALPPAHCSRGATSPVLRAPPALKAKGGHVGAASHHRVPVLSDDSWTTPGPSHGKGHQGSSRHDWMKVRSLLAESIDYPKSARRQTRVWACYMHAIVLSASVHIYGLEFFLEKIWFGVWTVNWIKHVLPAPDRAVDVEMYLQRREVQFVYISLFTSPRDEGSWIAYLWPLCNLFRPVIIYKGECFVFGNQIMILE